MRILNKEQGMLNDEVKKMLIEGTDNAIKLFLNEY